MAVPVSSSEPILLAELLDDLDNIIVHPPKPCDKGGYICNITYRDNRTPLIIQLEPPTPVRFNVMIKTTDWKGAPCRPHAQIQKSLANNQDLISDLSKVTAKIREKLFALDFDGKSDYSSHDDLLFRRYVQNLVYTEKKAEKRNMWGEQPHIRYTVGLQRLPLTGDNAISEEDVARYREYGAIEYEGELYVPSTDVVNFREQRMRTGLNVLRRDALTLDIVRMGYIHLGDKAAVTNMQSMKSIVFQVPSADRAIASRDFSKYMDHADASAEIDEDAEQQQQQDDRKRSRYEDEEATTSFASPKRTRTSSETKEEDEEDVNDRSEGSTML